MFRGHDPRDLLEIYTIDQLWYYHEAAQKNLQTETLHLATGMRLAFHANKNEWQKYAKTVLGSGKKKKIEPMVMPKSQLPSLRRLLHGK
ncbi:MAG: hypothetical protein MUO24_02205 [Desulfobacterales bacterium]|nr:hypothetical protein [Desulfobacterales bacterium]